LLATKAAKKPTMTKTLNSKLVQNRVAPATIRTNKVRLELSVLELRPLVILTTHMGAGEFLKVGDGDVKLFG